MKERPIGPLFFFGKELLFQIGDFFRHDLGRKQGQRNPSPWMHRPATEIEIFELGGNIWMSQKSSESRIGTIAIQGSLRRGGLEFNASRIQHFFKAN